MNSILTYEPLTGRLLWKAGHRGPKCREGVEAGSVKSDGRYRTVFVNGKRLYCHRVVWEMVNGPIPAGMCIDHIDGNGLNNRLDNLRVTTRSGNQRNTKLSIKSRTGASGVTPYAKGGYQVQCAGEYIGVFADLEDAVAARKAAEERHGFHPNHGRNGNARAA